MEHAVWAPRSRVGCEITAEQSAVLPDYYPPIERVVRVSARAAVTSVTPGETTSVSGETSFTLLYQSSDGQGLHAYRTSLPFRQSLPLASPSPFCLTTLPAASCRLSAARRVSFKAVFGLYAEAAAPVSLPLPEKEEGVLFDCREVTAREQTGALSKRFSISEEVPVEGAAAAVLDAWGDALLRETVGAGGRSVVKGELCLSLLVADSEGAFQRREVSLPVSQILDLPFGDDTQLDARLTLGDLRAEVSESDPGGSRIALEADLTIDAVSTRPVRLSVVRDAFSPDYPVELERKKVSLCTSSRRLSGAAELHVPNGEPPAGVPVGAFAQVQSCSAVCAEDGKTSLEGQLLVSRLLREEDGRLFTQEEERPFSFAVDAPAASGGEARAVVAASSWQEDGLRLTLHYDLGLWTTQETELVAAASCDRAHPRPNGVRAPLTVYFAEPGEPVWEVAKRYGVDPERIRKANALEGDVIPERCRLLLPR